MKIVDKGYCMSSFLALRYIADAEKIFSKGVEHEPLQLRPDSEKLPCCTSDDIDRNIRAVMDRFDLSHAALFLSGGIDSGILASYMPKGSKAYTVHNESHLNDLEVERAARICEINSLEHIVIEVSWQDYQDVMDGIAMKTGYPVFGNTPQVYCLTEKAIADGNDFIVFGDDADLVFGGLDQLLSKDWEYDAFVKRVMYLDPKRVLKEPADLSGVFEQYRIGMHRVDFQKCIKEVVSTSTGIAYYNAFKCAGVNAVDPYTFLKMGVPLDLARIRSGESKYLLRELYKKKYPTLEIPEKIPMARPMDIWMKDWEGPMRDEFLPQCVCGLTGEQKFMIYSLERFLNRIEG